MRERDARKVLSEEGVRALQGKIVLDLNNRDYAEEVMGGNDGNGGKFFSTSLGEGLQANLPDSHIIKAFNTVAMEALDISADAIRSSGAQIFIAGGGGLGRAAARRLVEELGFEALDLGDGKMAMRMAEAAGDLVRFLMINRGMGGEANLGVRMLPEAAQLGLVGERQESSYH